MTWVLILFVGIGITGDTEANAVTAVAGFVSYSQCAAAGNEAMRKFGDGTKRVVYVCAEQGTKAGG